MVRACRDSTNGKAAPPAAVPGWPRAGGPSVALMAAGTGLGALIALASSAGPALSRSSGSDGGRHADLQWSRYTSDQLGTGVDVPVGLFAMSRPLPQGADGRLFQTRDGSAMLRVSGSFGPRVAGSFAAYRKLVIQDEPTMSYRTGGRSWFVLSGRQNGEIRYTKVIERCGAAHAVFLHYPALQKRFYDPIVSRISSSLTANCPAR